MFEALVCRREADIIKPNKGHTLFPLSSTEKSTMESFFNVPIVTQIDSSAITHNKYNNQRKSILPLLSRSPFLGKYIY